METELKHTKCKGCGTNQRPIFIRPNARSADDYWCKACMDKGKHLDG